MVSNGRNPRERWQSALSPVTAKKNGEIFDAWIRWVRESGGRFSDYSLVQLVAYQKQAQGDERFDILEELVYPYLGTKKGRRYGYIRQLLSVLRSFFMHNRAEIPRDPNYRIRADREKVVGTLTVEEVRNIVQTASAAYRAIFLAMLQGGMGSEEFEIWNRNGLKSVKDQLAAGKRIIRIDLPGRKQYRNRRTYYTMIGTDAVEALRHYIENVRPDVGDAIFLNNQRDAISKDNLYRYWMRHGRKIGAISPLDKSGDKGYRTGRSPHEIRDVFRSQWEKSPAKGSVAEFMMGHQVDPLEYNKAFRDEKWLRREYKKALPFLNILGSPRPFGQVDEDEVVRLEGMVEELSRRLERVQSELAVNIRRAIEEQRVPLTGREKPNLSAKRMQQLAESTSVTAYINPTDEEQEQVIQSEINRITNSNTYEVKEVSVEDLSKYIAQGYEIATPNPLPSGEYIVRKRR